ncbi:MAG: GAF domain-containing protein [Deltaproteobacteria bacterium]|nr:GAF domain-containing protein [Deltaproteobacteria bacterium]
MEKNEEILVVAGDDPFVTAIVRVLGGAGVACRRATPNEISSDPQNVRQLVLLDAQDMARAARDSALLVEITSKLVGSGDILDSLYGVARLLSEELDVDRCSMVLVRPQRDYGFVIASSDDPKVRSLPIDLKRYPEIDMAVSKGEPIVIDDVASSALLEHVLPSLRTAHVTSVALFPIAKDGEAVGVIFLRFSGKREKFHEREQAFCRTVAGATAIALRNAEVTEHLKARTMEMQKAQIETLSQLRSLRKYRDFFMGAVDGMTVLDGSGAVLFANPEAASLICLTEAEMQGRPFSDCLDPADGERFEGLLADFKHDRARRGVDLRTRPECGFQRVLSVAAGSLFGEKGMVLLTMRDVTDERAIARRLNEAQERLIASEKQAVMVELAGAAAHEINQPLTSILTSLAMLRRIHGGGEAAERVLSTLEQESERMATIVRRLSRITQYTTKSYVGEARIIDLEKACADEPDEGGGTP